MVQSTQFTPLKSIGLFLVAAITIFCVAVGISRDMSPSVILLLPLGMIPLLGIVVARNSFNAVHFPMIFFLLLTFIGYIIKFIPFAFNPSLIDPFETFCPTPLRDSITAGFLPKALEASLYGIVALSFGTWIVLLISGDKQKIRFGTLRVKSGAYVLMYGFCMMLHVIISAVKVYYGLGVMGAELEVLPFHLGGILVRTDEAVLPMILLASICFAKNAKENRSYLVGVFIYVVYFAIIAVVNASKGMLIVSLIKLVLTLGLFSAINGKIIAITKSGLRKTIIIFSLLILLFMGFHDMTAEFRELRKEMSVSAAVSQMKSSYNLLSGVEVTVLRVTGINSLVQCLYKVTPDTSEFFDNINYYMFSEKPFDKIYTADVEGIESSTHSSAPSLMGALYIIGGYPLMCLGCFVAPFLFQLLRWALVRKSLFGSTSYYACASITLVLLLVEGSIGYLGQFLLIFIPAVIVSEIIIRFFYSPLYTGALINDVQES